MRRIALAGIAALRVSTGLAEPVIDLHCHTAGFGYGESGCFVSDGMAHSLKVKAYLDGFSVTRDELEAQGDALVIRRLSERLAGAHDVQYAVVLAMDGVMDAAGGLDRARTELYVPGEFVARETRRTRNLLYGASVNPLRSDALARLDRAKRDGAVLVKLLPNIQRFDMGDPRCVPFFRRLKALGLPLLVHCGAEHAFTTADDALGDPLKLRLALDEGVTVFAAHCGGAGRTDWERNGVRAMTLLDRYPNLYFEISAMTLPNHHADLRRALRNPKAVERFVYGSDLPLPATPVVAPWHALFRIGPRNVWRLGRIANVWDRDVAYLKALGVPDAAFTRVPPLLAGPTRR